MVDPLLGVGGVTQLYTIIHLGAAGADWVQGPDGKRLYVSLPAAGEVAVVDLETCKVTRRIAVGETPMRLALQPDGKYLWVGHDGVGGAGNGVSLIDTATLAKRETILTGQGHHEIAFSGDRGTAFVTNSLDDTLSVVDTEQRKKVGDLDVGDGPVAVAYSSLSETVFAASAGDGLIIEIDPVGRRVVGTVTAAPGVVAMKVSPDGRWAFVANAEQDRVDVLDTSRRRIARTLSVGDQPHQLTFTDTYAYVRHLGTADVTLIPLAGLAESGTPAVQTVALGTRGAAEANLTPIADAISPTGEWTAVIAANPADRMVYYYMEGMIAPMGSYSTYGRVPRAVGIVDRSVREI